jgi:hypothetical protein
MEIELNRADEVASTEVTAASAANNDGKEIVMTGEEDSDTSEVDELIDYNEQDKVEAAKKAVDQKALKEMLTNNRFTLRNILRSKKVKGHFTSHFRKKMKCLLKTYFRKYRRKTYMK